MWWRKPPTSLSNRQSWTAIFDSAFVLSCFPFQILLRTTFRQLKIQFLINQNSFYVKPWSNRALCRFLIWRLMALWQDMKSGLSSLSIIFYTLDMGDIHTWMTMSRLRRSKQCRGKELNFPVDWCPLKQSRDSCSHHDLVLLQTDI